MPPTSIASFDEFWPHYVRAHTDPRNRLLHAVGTASALAAVSAGVSTGNLLLIAAAPVLGYGPAWIGHFVLEGNRPATFQHPFYSLRADFKMLWLMLQGAMAREVEKHATPADSANTAQAPSAARLS